jgi:hypothetical protein
LQFPAYAAPAVPYHWMLKENAKEKAALYDLNYDDAKEQKFEWAINGGTNWVQEITNQN